MKELLRIVGTDNFDRETVADFVWIDDVPPDHRVTLAKVCSKLNERLGDSEVYYRVQPVSQRLCRGMEDLV
jgi:hypothetical protein